MIKPNVLKRDANGNVIERSARFFQLHFDQTNEEHKNFLDQYQCIYPGEIFAKL